MTLRWIAALVAAAMLCACGGGAPPVVVPPAAAYTVLASDGDVTVTVDTAFGAAVTSVTDRHGNQYTDSYDHGREWQIAYQLDGLDEGENPTEAGASADGTSRTSTTSVVLSATSPAPNVLTTSTRPAYWKPYLGATISPDTVSKTITIGYRGLTNVIRWDVTIIVATDHPGGGVFEGLAGYGPAFPLLYVRQPDRSFALTPQVPGQNIVPTTSFIQTSADGSEAIGVLASDVAGTLAWNNIATGAYPTPVNIWGCAGWIQSPLPVGAYSRSCIVVVGTLAEVQASLNALEP